MDDVRGGIGGHFRFIRANPSALPAFCHNCWPIIWPRIPPSSPIWKKRRATRPFAALRGGTELAIIGENTPTEGLETFVCDVDELVPLFGPSAGPRKRSASPKRRHLNLVGITAGSRRHGTTEAHAAGQSPRSGCKCAISMPSAAWSPPEIGAAIVPRAAGAPHVNRCGAGHDPGLDRHAHRKTAATGHARPQPAFPTGASLGRNRAEQRMLRVIDPARITPKSVRPELPWFRQD